MSDLPRRSQSPRVTPELEAVAENFRVLSDAFQKESLRKLELARAAGDEQGLLREHIKVEVMRAARTMFQGSYRAVSGVRVWEPADV